MESNYVEELYLLADPPRVDEIAAELKRRWSTLHPNVSNLDLTIKNQLDDVFSVEENWRSRFGKDSLPESYVLVLVEVRFTVRSKEALNTDALGDSMYETIRKVIKNYPDVEYFSMFASEKDADLPLK
jgi:hypothetical protein